MTTIELRPHTDTRLHVPHMTCGRCAARIASALRALEGVRALDIDLRERVVQVTYATGEVAREQLVAAIERQGYRVQDARPDA